MSNKIIIGISASNSVDLLIGQLNFLKNNGYDVALLAPSDARVDDYCKKEGVRHIPVKIERNISLFKDFITLIALVRIFLREKPDIINLGTPKMSLLGMLAAFITRVPKRIYTCRGFRFEHETGVMKKLLISLEKVTSNCSHKVYCISKSVRDLGVKMKLFPLEKTRLIGHGSSNGVDLSLFNPKFIKEKVLYQIKSEFQLHDHFVFCFVGRLVDRKGLKEMYDAFDEINQEYPNTRLLIIGRPFWDQIKSKDVINKLENHSGVIMTGFQTIDRVPYFLSASDIFILPAHWEGFGNVLIQAAAMGLPIIATEVTGCKDAVSNGFNGILVKNKNHNALVVAMSTMIDNHELRNTFSQNSITWSKNFQPQIIWEGYLKLYDEPV